MSRYDGEFGNGAQNYTGAARALRVAGRVPRGPAEVISG
jgi:hypothetical protein